MSNQYTENTIQKMDPLTFTRHRSDSYLGSNADSTQLAVELITNCIDEHLIGNCDKIIVDIDDAKNIITVADEGQGILPNVVKEDGKTVLEMVYGDINTSGKYDKSDNAVYEVSTGAFGIGASLTNFLSHWLIASTRRDGLEEIVWFNEGVFEKREVKECDKNLHGVTVKFQPNEDFFVDAHVNKNKLKEMLFNICCICPNLVVDFNKEIIHHPNGIEDLLQAKLGKNLEIINNKMIADKKEGRQTFDFGMTFSDSSSSSFTCFCNYGLIESGTPLTAVKSCITRTLNKWGQENGLLKKKQTLSGSTLQEGIIVVFNLVSPNIRYDSQTKVRVTSTEDNPFLNKVLSSALELWLDCNPEDGKKIIERGLIATKAAEAAKKAREAVKNKVVVPKQKKKFLQMPTTLIDATSKDRKNCELIIVEGLSAASSLVAQRDSSVVGVYSIRGMMLNVQKTAAEKIIANKEINNLITALGLEFNPKNAKMIYDASKLRYGKIIACSDADPAGAAIENLLFNILWQLCPELILNGHVYSAEPPLFKVTTSDNKYHFLADQQALNEFTKTHKNIKAVHRAKGLAEQKPEELAEAVLEQDTRKIRQITVSDIEQADKLFVDLYGKDVPPRVKFINENIWGVEVDYE